MISKSTLLRRFAAVMIMAAASLTHLYAVAHYGFRQIGSDEGLSASYVKAIAQDSDGFIWIGTKTGLDRYDGISVRNFPCVDREGKRGNNNIGAIYEDADRNLWVGTDRGVYIFDPRTEKFTILDKESPHGVKAEDWVETIAGDKQGNIWILIPNQGLFRHGKKDFEFYSVTNHNGNKDYLPLSFLVTKSGKIWVGTNHRGLYFFDPQNNRFRRYTTDDPEQNRLLESMAMNRLVEMADGSLVIGSGAGIFLRVEPAAGKITNVNFSRTHKTVIYNMLAVDNELWIGTTDGISIIDMNTGRERELSIRTMGERSLGDNIVSVMMMDRDKNIWVGTMFGGVTFVQRSGLIFEKYGAGTSQRGLTSNRIRGIAVGNDGTVYVGTEESGLNLLDTQSETVTKVPITDPEKKIVLCAHSFGDKVYIGYAQGGCSVYSGGKHIGELQLGNHPSSHDVYAVLEDKAGNLWVGASWGLFRRDAGKDTFVKIEDVGDGWLYDMIQDSHGRIWIASMGEGIWRYEPDSKTYHHYEYDEAHSNGLRSNSISSITEDSKGRLWFSTDRGGLTLYRPETDDFIAFGVECGFPDDTVYDVIEDKAGNLWFGTNRGLVKYSPERNTTKVFAKGNNQFNYNSAQKGPDGRFYMGGIDGLIVFNPEADTDDAFSDIPVYITNFSIGRTEANREENMDEAFGSILFTDKIELGCDVSSFSVSLGSPIYVSHGKDVFMYRLLPSSEEWSVVSDPSNLTFAGISPGDYTLEVKRLGSTAEPRRLKIAVAAPWSQSWWANCIYMILFLSLIFSGWMYYRRRQLRMLAEKENIFTIEKEKELYKKKMQFFTEIAHEIRTPLTLIGTPLEAIEEIGVKDSRIQRYLVVIRKNTSRLLDLTSQILDFQKMDSERHPLKFEIVDIYALVQDTVDRFEMTLSSRNKQLTCHIPSKQILANVDKDAVIKILSNLFNNAMKYSDSKIEISLTADDENFCVEVKSDGEKIAGENRYRIFEPFFQATNKTDNGGVGIGLPLCRTLAHLHGGTIELVDDKEPNSNTFRLIMPVKVNVDEPEAMASPAMAEYVMEEVSPMLSDNSSYSILLVDDNDEMREFLNDQLSKYFVVETAEDGEKALEKMRGHRFDLVVTDIMMPVMDGYELCKAIKADPDLSPIPVVFLTAKNDLESKVKALECGGESFIEKPFSIKYFRQQIKSLLDNRRHERKSFLNKPFFPVDNIKMNKADEEFMNKVIKLINENIDKENFNVESMASEFCMSRSSLLRKIKTLFNLSPVELIRIVRLKKAAELIQVGKYRMGDICFMVGINSQSYFTRLFLKQFGMTPKAFENQCKQHMHPDGSPWGNSDSLENLSVPAPREQEG